MVSPRRRALRLTPLLFLGSAGLYLSAQENSILGIVLAVTGLATAGLAILLVLLPRD